MSDSLWCWFMRLKMAWHLSIVMPPITWREPFWREDSPTLHLNKENFDLIMIATIMQSLRLMTLRYIPRMPYTGVQVQTVAQTNDKFLGTDTYINLCIPRIGFPPKYSGSAPIWDNMIVEIVNSGCITGYHSTCISLHDLYVWTEKWCRGAIRI